MRMDFNLLSSAMVLKVIQVCILSHSSLYIEALPLRYIPRQVVFV
jgi:hypothetical protein